MLTRRAWGTRKIKGQGLGHPPNEEVGIAECAFLDSFTHPKAINSFT
jgi:hypothetical protein